MGGSFFSDFGKNGPPQPLPGGVFLGSGFAGMVMCWLLCAMHAMLCEKL